MLFNKIEHTQFAVTDYVRVLAKTKPTYTTRTSSGGIWTLLLIFVGSLLTISEIRRWFVGDTSHTYSVEHGVAHTLQINLDVVVRMQCHDLHINVQDASGDRILAGDTLRKDPTNWDQWGKQKGIHTLGVGDERDRISYGEEDVHDYLGAARRKKKFKKTPRIRGDVDSCRVFGSMEGNKVQGDFHITARGHGYMEFGPHLDHNAFNFSHYINELSFGPFYPSLTNPLDDTVSTIDMHFYRHQYYVSIVPTIYTTTPAGQLSAASLASGASDLESQSLLADSSSTIHTNQYAVTSQSHPVPESQVPGIFVKYDIEPITLLISEESASLLSLLVRLVNVASGVVVAGGWCYQLTEWAREVSGRRGRKRMDSNMGMLHGRDESQDGMMSKKGY
ncbi:MAG: hypothetical protein M1821_007122 [Bathelium mastoideum]|nr:MAG: hypothetical protein M1821_007122 [Bathelium mastoideum]